MRDPAKTMTYASGRESPNQSMSDMLNMLQAASGFHFQPEDCTNVTVRLYGTIS